MFGNCSEKMLVISSNNTNEWSQGAMQTNNNRIADAKTFNNIIMASSSAATALPSAGVLGLREKTGHQRQQPQSQPQPQPQEQLKCPRCDSSNTKFCYYNNYSLSQPRHFCKACKRYWTRGGTLRNVPVGGGCRKNKRVKRPPTSGGVAVASSSSSLDGSSNSTNTSGATTIIPNSQISHFSSTAVSNGYMNPLFYGLQGAGDGTFPVISDRFNNSKVSSSSGLDSDFGINDLNSLELGFLPLSYNHTSGLINTSIATINKQFHDSSCNDPLFGSLSSSPTPSVAALLASTALNHQKLIHGCDIPRNTELLGSNHLQTLAQLQDLQVGGNNNEAAIAMNKEGKLDHQISGHIGLSSDPPIYNSWNAGGVGAWLDPTSNNIGSSLTSLI